MNVPATMDRVSRDRAELEASMLLARATPRDEPARVVEILRACEDPAVAAAGFYRVKRGRETVVDASIGLAREIRRLWGHLRSGVRVHPSTGDDIHVEGWAHDLQRNTHVAYEHRLPRKVLRRVGNDDRATWIESDDENALRELAQSVASRLERNAILRIVPETLVNAALARCLRTSEEVADGKRPAEAVDVTRAILSRFARYGVTRDDLEAKVGERLERLAPRHLATLREIARKLDEGSLTAGDAFPIASAPSGPSSPSTSAPLEGEHPGAVLEPGDVAGDVSIEETAAHAATDGAGEAPPRTDPPPRDARVFRTRTKPKDAEPGDQWERPDGIVLTWDGSRFTVPDPPTTADLGEIAPSTRGWLIWTGHHWSDPFAAVRDLLRCDAKRAREVLEAKVGGPMSKAAPATIAAAAARVLLDGRSSRTEDPHSSEGPTSGVAS